MNAYFESTAVRKLQTLLEEVTRASPGGPESRFVEPDRSVTDRLESRFHHALYGRRGSGKTSLLRHVAHNKRRNGQLVAWIDYEILMNLSYPDVLVTTLQTMFTEFASQLTEFGIRLGPPPTKWWHRKAPSRTAPEQLLWDLRDVAAQLEVLKNQPDQSEISWSVVQSEAASISLSQGSDFGLQVQGLKAGASSSESKGSAQSEERSISSSYVAKKEQHLERALDAYRNLALRVHRLYPDPFVILDEVYRLKVSVQPSVVGYLHRVVKDTGVWLKIGSLRYGTQLYAGGPPAVGLQAPHDIRDLSLDRGLLEFRNSKRFLEAILRSLAEEVEVNVDRLLSPGAFDRLVLASGGVPRDYLAILSEAIAVARNRGVSTKSGSERVTAEDVNEAAGRTVELKFRDLDEIAGNDRAELKKLVLDLTTHCRRTGSACFLIDFQDQELHGLVDRLQNMRFAHLLDTSESLPIADSSRYNVYLLDVSQLAAQRALQLDFMGWTTRKGRRSRKLVFRRNQAEELEQAEAGDASPRTLAGETLPTEMEEGTQHSGRQRIAALPPHDEIPTHEATIATEAETSSPLLDDDAVISDIEGPVGDPASYFLRGPGSD